jgi:ribose 5-phosphate isomerase B
MDDLRNMKIAVGSDHAGLEIKSHVLTWLKGKMASVKDFGTNSSDSTDYPDYAHAVASAVEQGEYELGVLVCGTGIGVDITANKHQGIRSALVWNKDIAKLARSHNNANILSLPGRFIDIKTADEILEIFFSTKFEGGRHQNRIDKIRCG